MNERQAFCAVVLAFAYKDWSPAAPDEPTLDVNGKARTPRQICRLVSGILDKLPDEVVGALIMEMRDRELRKALGKDRTYRTGADCLLKWMERRVEAYQQRI